MTFQTNFLPSSFIISNITNANPGVVTTSTPNNYLSGNLVRLVCPESIGMNQVLNNVYKISVIDSTHFSINADTSNFDAYSPVNELQLPQVIPVGNNAPGLLEATRNADNIIPET